MPLPTGGTASLCPACQLAATLPGTRVGDYEITQEIARGGMGVVYRARQLSLNREVALKMVGSSQLLQPHDLERFQVETEAAARLDHPNILPVHEVGQWQGRPFFTMKLVEGSNLQDEMQGHPLPPRKAVGLLIKVARAVQYAHQRGVLHRDLKPTNVLLDSHGEPQLTDFGLAKIQERDSGLTQTVAVMGSASYMAPEQARGQTRDLTTAADVYGLGAILYETLTGRAPFEGTSFVEILRKVVEEDPPRPSSHNRAVDRDLETICLKCLEKDPRDRYGTALDLARDLERWLHHEPVEARPLGLRERVLKWIRRRPAIAALSLALGGVTVLGLATVVWQWRAAVAARQAAEESVRAEITARAPVIAPKRTFPLPEGTAELTLLFPDAQRAMLPLPTGPEIRDLRTGRSLVRLEGFLDNLQWAVLSGDGQRLVSISSTQQFIPRQLQRGPGVVGDTDQYAGDQHLQVWETSTGRLLQSLTLSNLVHSVALSRDGTRLALGHVDGQVDLWDTDSGRDLQAWKRHSGTVIWTGFSPASSGPQLCSVSLGWVQDSPSGRPVPEPVLAGIYDVATGEVTDLGNRFKAGPFGGVGVGMGAFEARWSRDGRYVLTLAALAENAALWEVSSGRFLYEVADGLGRIPDADFSPTQDRFVTAHEDYTARIRDVSGGREIAVLRGHDFPIHVVRYSPDGRRILTASADHTIRIWDAETGLGLAVLKGHQGKVLSAEFSPDGSEVVSVGEDHTVRVWDAATMEQLSFTLDRHESGITFLSFSPDSRLLLSGERSLSLVWDVLPERVRHEMRPGRAWHEMEEMFGIGQLEEGVFDPSGQWLATATTDSHLVVHAISTEFGSGRERPYTPVRVWDLNSGIMRFAPSGMETWVEQLQGSPDGRYLAVVPSQVVMQHEVSKLFREVTPWIYQTNAPLVVPVWDVVEGRRVAGLGPLPGPLKAAAWSRSSQQLAMAGWGGVSLWSIPEGILITNLVRSARDVTDGVALSAEGVWWTAEDRHVLVAFGERFGLWDPAAALPVLTVEGPGQPIFQRHFDPVRQEFMALTMDGQCWVWNVLDGQVRMRFGGLDEKPTVVAWSPDGLWLAVRRRDREISVFHLATGREVVVLEGHPGMVSALAFSPDMRWLASGDGVGRIRVWPMQVIVSQAEQP